MSDRASTEKRFHNLLEDFRETILPDVIENWSDMDEQERLLCTKMNNFFCGLHLMVGMADASEACLKKFERNFLDGKDIGSGCAVELKRYHKAESGTLRLIRTCCKAFAVGEDEKNGERNTIMRFKHNRFNLVFVLGHAVYFHGNDISHFLDNVHGAGNSLLRAVSLDVKEHLYLAGVRSLGLISKFVTGPLWKCLESKCHILDMNDQYKRLVDFLEKGSRDTEVIADFMRGESTPFDTTVTDDKVLSHLLEENPEVDEIVCPLLGNIFQTFHQLLSRMVTDHLPGGKFSNPTDELYIATTSVMPHNKLPEFVFGQLDQLLRYRPNSTILTNEAFLMYSHNRTGEWLQKMDKERKINLLETSMKEGVKIREKFQERIKEIQKKRAENQRRRQKELEEREKKRIQAAEALTIYVCYYGLWQSSQQVEEGLQSIPLKEKRTALESQLKFRKQVLKQKFHDPKVFSFSRKNDRGSYAKIPIDELKSNVLKLIEDTIHSDTVETSCGDHLPLFVGKHIDHTFTDGVVYPGYVVSVVPGFSSWYNIVYVEDPAVYAYNLHEDYKKGDVKIVVHPAGRGMHMKSSNANNKCQKFLHSVGFISLTVLPYVCS